eukprot:937673-Amphidinium_carterae.1
MEDIHPSQCSSQGHVVQKAGAGKNGPLLPGVQAFKSAAGLMQRCCQVLSLTPWGQAQKARELGSYIRFIVVALTELLYQDSSIEVQSSDANTMDKVAYDGSAGDLLKALQCKDADTGIKAVLAPLAAQNHMGARPIRAKALQVAIAKITGYASLMYLLNRSSAF